MLCHNMSNEAIPLGDCFECSLHKSNKRNADNYAAFVKQSVANNDLIVENILKWLKPSHLIKCSQVCKKWQLYVQLLICKRNYFSHLLLYFLLSPEQLIKSEEQDFMRTSLEEMINSLNLFVARNEMKEFKFIIIFSKLDYNHLRSLIDFQLLNNDSKVIHINTENEIIGTLVGCDKPFKYLESRHDINLLAGISGLFISGGMPGLQVNVYKDSQIFDIKTDTNLKCVLVFHIWRSFYGGFRQLKTDNEYFEHIESFVHNSKYLAFGGVTVDRIAFFDNCDETKTYNLNCFLDHICCVTFSGHNVYAHSYVLDFNNSDVDNYLSKLSNELKLSSPLCTRTEKIAFVFSEHLKESTLKLTKFFENIRFIGCSGIVHGSNYFPSNLNFCTNERLFFKKGKCVLVIILINKSLEI